MKQRAKKRLPRDARQRSDGVANDQPGNPPAVAAWFERRKDWLLAIALVVVVFLAYQPAWQGGLIWDDEAHVRPDLQSWHGLCRIWCDVKATQQYYPLLHSAFWLEYRLWGNETLGYHLVNILLHVAAALLVAVILRRLKIPGAYLAAAIFAQHPVHVESVAWITELKNTLSAVFYLSAALAYLRFDDSRKKRIYALALGLFVLGLMSKTVTATLPAALLVVFWWQRGRLSWRRDVLPLLPFFTIGAVAGVCTALVERKLAGAEGVEFDFTIVERCLIAGRAIWFYLGKLIWPADLIFIYPRWHVSQAVWWQYLFPLAVLALVAGLWAIRRRCRGPLAGFLFFAGTLFPVLGFCNVYPFIFSFVADHFQYLASLGIITLTSAGIALLLSHWRLWGKWPAYCVCGALLAVLATRTWTQCWVYYNIDQLYTTTIEGNRDCWMAYNNLGQVWQQRDQFDEAAACYRKAFELNPNFWQPHVNLGTVYAHFEQTDKAMAEYRKALAINPDCADAFYNIGITLTTQRQLPEAIANYRKALALQSNHASAHCNLGAALERVGKIDEAIAEYRKSLELNPQSTAALCNLGKLFVTLGRYDEAIAEYRKAYDIYRRAFATHPGSVEARQMVESLSSLLEELRAKGAPPKNAG